MVEKGQYTCPVCKRYAITGSQVKELTENLTNIIRNETLQVYEGYVTAHCNECDNTFPSIQHMYAMYQCPKCMLFNTEVTRNACSDEQKREYEEKIKTIPGYVVPPALTMENIKRFVTEKYKDSSPELRSQTLRLMSQMEEEGFSDRIIETIRSLIIAQELSNKIEDLILILLML